jgi:hypothetical protein
VADTAEAEAFTGEAADFTAAEILVDSAGEQEVLTAAEALVAFAVEASKVFTAEAFAEVASLVDLVSLVMVTDSALVSAPIGDTRTTTDMDRGGILTLTMIRTIPTTTRMVLMTLGTTAILATIATAAIIAMRMIIRANPITKMLRQSLRAQMFPKALLSVSM